MVQWKRESLIYLWPGGHNTLPRSNWDLISRNIRKENRNPPFLINVQLRTNLLFLFCFVFFFWYRLTIFNTVWLFINVKAQFKVKFLTTTLKWWKFLLGRNFSELLYLSDDRISHVKFPALSGKAAKLKEKHAKLLKQENAHENYFRQHV